MVAAFIDDMSAPMPAGSLVSFHLSISYVNHMVAAVWGLFQLRDGQTKELLTCGVGRIVGLLTDAAGASSGLPPLM